MGKKETEFTPLKYRRLMEKMKKDKLRGNYLDDSFDDLDSGELPQSSSNLEDDYQIDLDEDSLVNPEIIRPMMSWWDKNDLTRELKRQEEKYNLSVKEGERYNSSNIPEYITYDLYSLFNNSMNDISFVKPNEDNKWKFDLTQKFNDYLLRTITERNSVNSFITVNEFVKMLSKLVQEEKQKPENKGKSDEELLQDVIKKGSNGGGEQKKFDQALNKAKKEIEDKQQQVKDAGGLQASKSDNPFEFKEIGAMLDFAHMVKHIPLNHKFVANFVNKSLKFSAGYFSNSYKQFEESILDSDTVDSIENCEDLLPIYRNLNIEDLMTNYRKYNLAFDVFIDNSGSMSSTYNFDSKSITGFDLCKIMALKLHKMNIVKDVYLFNDTYKKVDDINTIFKLGTCGGTQIDRVVDFVNKTGRPAVVLTDMQDTICHYSNKVFFIGILDAEFCFDGTGKRFGTNKQCIKFNKEGKFNKVHQL